MRINRKLVTMVALTTGLFLSNDHMSLHAQDFGGEGGYGMGGEGMGMEGPDSETMKAYRAFREKFKGVVHVTYELRVGNVKAQTQSGLALLIKKSEGNMGGYGDYGFEGDGGGPGGTGGAPPGGMTMGGMGELPPTEHEFLASQQLVQPELPKDLEKIILSVGSDQVSHRYIIRDLMASEKLPFYSFTYIGRKGIVAADGVCLMRLDTNGVQLVTSPADLDTTSLVIPSDATYFDATRKSLVPVECKEPKIGTVVVSADGGAGIAVSRKGKIEPLSGRQLFTAYVELLRLEKQKQQKLAADSDPFGGSEVASDDPFSSGTEKQPAQTANDQREIDDSLVRALTIVKQSKDDASRKTSIDDLRSVLTLQFESQRAVRGVEIAELRGRLDQLEAEEKSKRERAAEIIEGRIQQLLKN